MAPGLQPEAGGSVPLRSWRGDPCRRLPPWPWRYPPAALLADGRLELSEDARHAQAGPASRRACINRLICCLQRHALLDKPGGDGAEVCGGAGEAVDLGHEKGVLLPHDPKYALKLGPVCGGGPAALLAEHDGSAGTPQIVLLNGEVLVGGADTGRADDGQGLSRLATDHIHAPSRISGVNPNEPPRVPAFRRPAVSQVCLARVYPQEQLDQMREFDLRIDSWL